MLKVFNQKLKQITNQKKKTKFHINKRHIKKDFAIDEYYPSGCANLEVYPGYDIDPGFESSINSDNNYVDPDLDLETYIELCRDSISTNRPYYTNSRTPTHPKPSRDKHSLEPLKSKSMLTQYEFNDNMYFENKIDAMALINLNNTLKN